MLVYGPDGVGKSTFAAQAPNAIFLGSEDGTNNLDVTRFPAIKKWSDIGQAVEELRTATHEFKTLVIDSLDWLEPVLHTEICERYGAKSIELAAGGYGKGYVEAVSEWSSLCKALSALREQKGMNVIMIAHSEVVKFNDPTLQNEYDRYQLKLYKKSAAMFREFVDTVFFINYEMFSKKDGSKTRTYGDGARVIYTERRPGFDAKNRFGLDFQIPLSWDDYEKSISSANPHDPTKLREAITALLAEVKDEELKKKVTEIVGQAGDDGIKLEAIKNKLLIRLGEQNG